MNAPDIGQLLDYNYWARDRVFAAVARLTPDQYTRDLSSSFNSIRDTLVHVYSAEWIWYMRWQGTSPTSRLSADRFPDLPALQAAWSELEGHIRAHVERVGEAGLAAALDYKLLNGQPGRAVLWQMIQHVVNHGAYHRGQVTTMLRQLGAAPPESLDLITFYLERAR